MKKQILLLQFRTDASRKHELDQIIEKGGFKRSEIKVVNLLDKRYKVPTAKDVNKYRAVITGASGQFNVTDWPDEIRKPIERIYPFLRALIKSEVPTLAICFGHQLVAKMYGGQVKSDPMQHETGVYDLKITPEGKKSKIFEGLPSKFTAVCGHKDSVTRLPKGAKLLASSKKCLVHAYQLEDNFYSVQFHPELDRDGLVWRISLYPQYMKGKTVEEVKATFKPIPFANKVVKNFAKIVVHAN